MRFTIGSTVGMPAVNLCSMTSISAISFIYCHMKGDLDDASHLYTPLRFSLPWDQNSIQGWIYEVIYSAYTSSAYLFVDYALVSFFASFSFYCRAYRQYFQTFFDKIDVGVCTKNYGEITRQLYAAIRFRNAAKRYLNSFSKHRNNQLQTLLFAEHFWISQISTVESYSFKSFV